MKTNKIIIEMGENCGIVIIVVTILILSFLFFKI